MSVTELRPRAVPGLMLVLLGWALTADPALYAGGSSLPDASALEASLVRVHLVRKFPGLVVRGRWVPESSVVEILDLGGIVLDAEGNIAVFTVVPWLRSPEEESEFFVLSDDKRELPAQLIGVDQRISLLLVQVREKLGAPPAQIRSSPDEGGAHLVYWDENQWRVGWVWIREQEDADPPLEKRLLVKAKEGLPGELRGAGAFLADPEGGFAGIVTAMESVGFGKSLRELRLIPAETLRESLRTVKTRGSIRIGWLGVLLDRGREQAVIAKVFEGSPAEAGGLREGDRVIRVGDREITDKRTFLQALRRHPPAEAVPLLLEREGRKLSLSVQLGEWPMMERPHFMWSLQLPERWPPPDRPPGEGHDSDPLRLTRVPMELGWELGFMVDSLTPQLAEFFKVPQGYGLLVKSVKEESPAYRSGFRAGDILVEINGRRLRSPRDFHHALEGVRGGELDIMFVREGRVQTRHVVLH